jgi:hypothetical protein
VDDLRRLVEDGLRNSSGQMLDNEEVLSSSRLLEALNLLLSIELDATETHPPLDG